MKVPKLQKAAKASKYLEMQDDGPNETKDQIGVAVNNVRRSDVLQMDATILQEVQCPPHILQVVHSEASPCDFQLGGRAQGN